MKIKNKVRLISTIVASVILIGSFVGVLCYNNHLEQLQATALLEIEENRGEYNDNVIVLSSTNKRRAEKLATAFGATLRITNNGKFATLTLPDGVGVSDIYSDDANRKYIKDMSLDYRVSFAEDDEEEILHAPNYDVSDSYYNLQSYLNYINIGNVWNSTLGANKAGEKVTVAVIDTGIDTDHPEFFDADGNSIISAKSYNASTDKVVELYDMSVIDDTQGHGTAVAGVIAAQMNGLGIVGIAPEVELIVIKCETIDGGEEFKSASDIIFSIYYAIECDVDVINMSLGGDGNDFADALQLAVDSDIIPVAAAGNNSTDAPHYPAADLNAIGVGALKNDSFEIADYSNFGPNSDIMAPGTVLTAAVGGGYTYKNGTSFSSPIVSAAIALYISQNEYVNYEDVKAELLAAGKDLGNLGEDDEYGFGCLDISAFILEEKGVITYDYCTEYIESTKQVFVRQHTIQTVPEPERDNIIFDDWYYDKAYTRVFDYDAWYITDMVEDITLYAKWVNEDDEGASVYNHKTLADGTIEITSYKGKRRYLTIPDTIDDKVVSSIGERAFAGNTRLRGVTLPTGLVQIKDRAFSGVSKLREVTFTGDQLASIGVEAFACCRSLEKIKIPDSVIEIAEMAFAECLSMESVEITAASNLVSVGSLAFYRTDITTFYVPKNANFDGSIVGECDKLRSVTVHPENEKYIVEKSTVYNADKTKIVYYPAALGGEYTVAAGVSAIGNYAFSSSKITGVNIPYGVTTIEGCAFIDTAFDSVVIPDSVTTIDDYAFAYSKLKSVVLSENLTEISLGTFKETALTSVRIPTEVITVHKEAFARCLYLTDLTFAENSKLSVIDGDEKVGAFSGCSSLRSFALPESLERIGENAFKNCSSISELYIPRNVHYIGGGYMAGAFSECTSLKTVEFSSDCVLTNIPRECFASCTSLKSVKFSDAIIQIDMDAFNRCISLTELDFSEESHLITVGDGAFYACYALKSMQLPGSVTSIGELAYAFSGLESALIGRNVATIGKGALGACDSLVDITVDEENTSLKSIDNVLFNYDVTAVYCVPSSRIGSYTLPDSVRIVDSYSFYYCRELSEVILPSSLREINDSAFYYCSSLQGIEIPASVFNIGRQAFYYCTNLRSVSFAENSELERLGAYTFYRCEFDSFTVPASVAAMAQYVFYDCYKLTEITFEANSRLSYISAYMFRGCDALRTVIFEDGSALTSIQAHAFDGAYNLETIDFGDARIENIDNYAFYGNKKLVEFVLPTSVSYIGRYAFYGCEKFERVDLSILIEFIGENAFNNGLNNIKVFFASEELPEYAQVGWDNGIEGYYLNAKEYVEGDIWDYIITHSDTVSLVNYKGNNTVIIIDTLDGMTVEKLGAGVFRDNDAITSVILSNNVKEIGNYAFYGCDGINYILVTPSVEVIGKYAFASSKISVDLAEDSSLIVIKEGAFSKNTTETIILPDSVTTVGDYAFENSALSEIVVSDGSALSKIGKGAFVGTTIEEIYLPESLTLVDDNAFKDVTTLTRVTLAGGDIALKIGNSAFNNTGIVNVSIPKNVNYIGEYAFGANQCLQNIAVDKLNTSYTSLDGMLCDYYGTTLIQYPTGREGVVIIPKEITVLTYASFKDARKITEVSFEEGSTVKTIGWQTFSGCTGLTMITVPDSVVSFDFYVFENCTSLTDVMIGEDSKLSGVYEGAFYGCTALSNIDLPTSVAEISDYAFYNCKSLYFIPLGEGAELKLIGAYAFYGCENITSIPNYSKLLEIQDYAFGKTGVTEYTVPASLREISSYAFIGSLLENIYADEANINYVSIDGILFEKGATSASDFESIVIWPYTRTYILGYGKDTVTQADIYIIKQGFIKDYVFADTVNTIDDYAFYRCDVFESLTLPSTIVNIGNHAFAECRSLKSINIPENILNIEDYAFIFCTSLEEIRFDTVLMNDLPEQHKIFYRLGEQTDGLRVVVGKNVQRIPANLFYSAFYGPKVVSVEFEAESICESIGDNSFYSNPLASIILPESLTTIGSSSFSNCSSLVSVTIPESIVTMGDSAFSNCPSLEEVRFNAVAMNDLTNHTFSSGFGNPVGFEVIVGEKVTKIPAHLFQSSKVKNVIFEEGSACESIGAYAFAYATALEGINIPDDVCKTIGAYAFAYATELEGINIPEDVCKTIGDGAFLSCISLDEVTIPKGVEYIGRSAFSGCSSLVSVTISEEVEALGDHSFAGCVLLKEIIFNAMALEDLTSDNYVFANAGKDGEGVRVIFGKSVTKVPACLFDITSYYVPKLLSIEFEEGSVCESIGKYAFKGCDSLKKATIPESVVDIGYRAFYKCTSLQEIKFNAVEMNDFSSDNEIFSDAGENSTGIRLLFGSDVTKIPAYLFYPSQYDEVNIQSVEFEEGSVCKSVGEYTFCSCYSLKDVTIPEGMLTIGDYAFAYCNSLENLRLIGISTVGSHSFYGCSSIKELTIPEGAVSIGDGAFAACMAITKLTIPESVVTLERAAFSGCTAIEEINFNAVAMDDLSADNCAFSLVGNDGAGVNVTIGKNVTKIPTYLFNPYRLIEYSPKIVSVVFEDGGVCESIGGYAFNYCKNLLFILIPESVSSIGDYAFNGCSKLAICFVSETMPSNTGAAWQGDSPYYTDVKDIVLDEHNATYVVTNDGMASLAKYYGSGTSFDVKDRVNGCDVVDIARYAFYYSSSLVNVTLPDSVVSIGEGAFSNCLALESITIPETVTFIGGGAFYSCNSLKDIVIPRGVTEIHNSTFYCCSSLSEIIIPEGVTTIGAHAFSNCHNLKSLTIPESVVSIDEQAFSSCSILEDVRFNAKLIDAVDSLNGIFRGSGKNVGGIKVVFGKNVTKIPNYLFREGYVSSASFEDGSACASIGDYAFYGCTMLESIIIPENVLTIGDKAFYGCTAVLEVQLLATKMQDMPSSSDFVFANLGQSTDGATVIIGKDVTRVPAYLFGSYSPYTPKIVSIEFEEGSACESIGRGAFSGCSALERLTLPESITAIGMYAFSSADITYLRIPKNVTTIENGAFNGATNLSVVRIDSLDIIAQITNAHSLGDLVYHAKSVLIPQDVQDVGSYLESGFANVEEISCLDGEYVLYSTEAHNWVFTETLTERIQCVQDGLELYLCEHCLADKIVMVSQHSWIKYDGKDVSCTELGWNAYEVCSVCDYTTYAEIPATGHNYSAVVTAPTCTEVGYTTHTCHCGDTYVDSYVDASGHRFGSWKKVADATCTTAGEEKRSCQKCSYYETREISARGHGYSRTTTYPTCTTDGYTIFVCIYCGDTYVGNYVDAYGHKLGNWILTQRPTCTEAGIERRSCNSCNYYEEREAAATGHSCMEKVTPPTCTEQGYTIYVCDYCRESFVDDFVEATGHNYNAVVTAPTCTEQGYTTYTCHCGDSYIDDKVAALGHDVVYHEAQAPTCTEMGFNAYENCARCDYTTYAEISAPGHSYNAVVTAPTCTESGYTTYTCAVCDDTYVSDEVPASGHTEVIDAAVAPTCTATGLTEGKRCSVCNEVLVAQIEIAAKGHNMDDVMILEYPDCENEGQEYFGCMRCGYFEIRSIAALGHETVYHANRAPTCTEAGWNDYETCVRCNYTTFITIPATGHDYTEWDLGVKPGCETNGKEERKCNVCGHYEARSVDALGHDEIYYLSKPPSCTEHGFDEYVACSRCDYTTYVEIPAKGHSLDVWVPTITPGCETDGEERRWCMECDYYETKIISALGHTNNGEAKVENLVSATCTEDGSYDLVVYCVTCGEEQLRETKTVPKRGHIPDVAVSCENDQTCIICGIVLAEKLGHRYEERVIAPTCTTAGYTTYDCMMCGDQYVADEVPAKGHTVMIDAAVAPTCKETGLTEGRYCMECKEIFAVQTIVPATGHSYNAVVTDPTCTTAGYTTYTCAICEDAYVSDEVPATGHSYNAVVTAPTCTGAGYTTYTCAVCDDTYVSDEVNAGGHTEVVDGAVAPTCTATGLTEGKHCAVCNEVLVAQTEIAAKGHTLGEIIEIVSPTCDANGIGRRDCADCPYFEFCDIAALGYLQVFIDTVSSLSSGQTAELAYSELSSAIQLYAKLTEEEKVEASEAFRVLQAAIEAYNAKVEIANGEMEKATEIAFLPITAGFAFLAALWFLLKKKFWIK